MRISDWSSDVGSSDLRNRPDPLQLLAHRRQVFSFGQQAAEPQHAKSMFAAVVDYLRDEREFATSAPQFIGLATEIPRRFGTTTRRAVQVVPFAPTALSSE